MLRRVTDDVIVQLDMGNGFVPFRRNVTWQSVRAPPVATLVHQLDLTRGKNWGYQLRLGLLELTAYTNGHLNKPIPRPSWPASSGPSMV